MRLVHDTAPSIGRRARWAERRENAEKLPAPPHHTPLSLHVGIISSDPLTLSPLLHDLAVLRASPSIGRLAVIVLDNASPGDSLTAAAEAARARELEVSLVGVAQQRLDAGRGAFGSQLRERPDRPVGIAAARTMLQRYLGATMELDPGSFGWILDDDMRIDERARWYLSWLPAFRAERVDVLFGGLEGGSPNPPMHGVQGQLLDLLHNMRWLRSLSPSLPLPDRSAENIALRTKFPDYYYDLSRKHTGHLDTPLWLEPRSPDETAAEACTRLLEGAADLSRGAPLTRALVASMPASPLTAATVSVNRGGNTFVLTPRALRETPNTAPRVGSGEGRRSDMFWAIVSRHYRRLTLKAVSFPVVHHGRIASPSGLALEKTAAEIVGAAAYAALTELLDLTPDHQLHFSAFELETVTARTVHHREQRLTALSASLRQIARLREQLGREARRGELTELLAALDELGMPQVFEGIRALVCEAEVEPMARFFASLRTTADDYASAPPLDVSAIRRPPALGATQ